MKLLIGLGNPGEKYINNRHNVGHMLINKINKDNKAIKAIKTDIFMNDSGKFVAEKLQYYKVSVSDLYIIHDDLDIKLGEYKIQKGIGPKVHNGVKSVEEALGTKDFWRIRIGIDNRNNQDTRNKIQGVDYVLQDFTKEELEIIKRVQEDIYAEIENKD